MKTGLKKIENLWTILCQGSTVDATTNNLSLINIVEQIQIGKRDLEGKIIIPERGEAVPLNFQVVSLWKRLISLENEFSFDAELRVFDPEGKELSKHGFPVQMMKWKERMRSIVTIQGFKVTIPGEYTLKLYARENSKEKFEEASRSSLAVQFAIK